MSLDPEKIAEEWARSTQCPDEFKLSVKSGRELARYAMIAALKEAGERINVVNALEIQRWPIDKMIADLEGKES